MTLLSISFGRWSGAGKRFFSWRRIYWKGYKWTPFVVGVRRFPTVTVLEERRKAGREATP